MALAEMYKNGHGCRKSLKTAGKIYSDIYEDAERILVKDKRFTDWFVMASLHMFDCCAHGIGMERDIRQAYRYLLQAKYAAVNSIQYAETSGSMTIAEEIQKRAESITSEDYEILCPEDGYRSRYPEILESMIKQAGAVYLDLSVGYDGCAVITATAERNRNNSRVLITVPENSYCELTDTVRLRVADLKSYIEAEEGTVIRVDDISTAEAGGYSLLWDRGKDIGVLTYSEFMF